GSNAAKIAVGLGAQVTLFDLNPTRLKELNEFFGSAVNVLMSNPVDIAESIAESDLAIGSVLIPGAKAPQLVSEEMVKTMAKVSVVICSNFGTSDSVTSHDYPTHVKHGVIHYYVSNMPGAVPRTSTVGLTNATITYALQIANKGYQKAALENEALAKGVNIVDGKITNKGVASSLGYEYAPLFDLI